MAIHNHPPKVVLPIASAAQPSANESLGEFEKKPGLAIPGHDGLGFV